MVDNDDCKGIPVGKLLNLGNISVITGIGVVLWVVRTFCKVSITMSLLSGYSFR